MNPYVGIPIETHPCPFHTCRLLVAGLELLSQVAERGLEGSMNPYVGIPIETHPCPFHTRRLLVAGLELFPQVAKCGQGPHGSRARASICLGVASLFRRSYRAHHSPLVKHLVIQLHFLGILGTGIPMPEGILFAFH